MNINEMEMKSKGASKSGRHYHTNETNELATHNLTYPNSICLRVNQRQTQHWRVLHNTQLKLTQINKKNIF